MKDAWMIYTCFWAVMLAVVVAVASLLGGLALGAWWLWWSTGP